MNHSSDKLEYRRGELKIVIVNTLIGSHTLRVDWHAQARPQDFGQGVPCRLGRKQFENLTTKWCILKYI